ncbi:hypothetical protein PRZ48_013068 [Zasmidium cellare]|uniref:Protein kinase domain-containing protein n=1 Tax=Zasmidium cellare TaxID=395010 RepID=A0ABR0E314_ZASCE|nr:hypothetical protein PRZ48_013068 [Zasmidium cellare]
MLTFLRSLLFTAPDEQYDGTLITSDLETGLDPDPIAPIGYELSPGNHSTTVPWSAHPQEGQRGYTSWFSKFEAVIHKDATSVLVFPTHFMYDNPITGEVIYNEMGFRCDDGDPKDRLEEVARVYEWVFERGDGRLWPGPVPWVKPKVEGEGEVLRLFWSWAMQILSALVFLHGRGVCLGSFSEDVLWVREDMSVAVACLIGAGCEREDVLAGGYEVPVSSPWHEEWFGVGESEDGGDWRFKGHVKADLVDWANVVFRWMAGNNQDVLRFHQNPEKPAPAVKDEVSKRWRQAYAYRGELVGFRRLEKKLLGNVIVDVMMGKYESAEEVLNEVRKTIGESGGIVCGELGDEVDGDMKLEEVFEVVENERGGNKELRLRHVLDGSVTKEKT